MTAAMAATRPGPTCGSAIHSLGFLWLTICRGAQATLVTAAHRRNVNACARGRRMCSSSPAMMRRAAALCWRANWCSKLCSDEPLSAPAPDGSAAGRSHQYAGCSGCMLPASPCGSWPAAPLPPPPCDQFPSGLGPAAAIASAPSPCVGTSKRHCLERKPAKASYTSRVPLLLQLAPAGRHWARLPSKLAWPPCMSSRVSEQWRISRRTRALHEQHSHAGR